ncbi:hypothetical protein ACFQX6_23435 [Streptosporangium lutulentum]
MLSGVVSAGPVDPPEPDPLGSPDPPGRACDGPVACSSVDWPLRSPSHPATIPTISRAGRITSRPRFTGVRDPPCDVIVIIWEEGSRVPAPSW